MIKVSARRRALAPSASMLVGSPYRAAELEPPTSPAPLPVAAE